MHARRTTFCVLLATGQTMRPGLDVSRDETFTLASFAARGFLLIEPTLVLQRHRGVTGSVTGGEIRQRRPPRARTRGARISFVITVCGRRPPARAAVEGPKESLPSERRLRSLRQSSPRYWPPANRHRELLRVHRAACATPREQPISATAHRAGRSPLPGSLPRVSTPAPPLSGRPIRRAQRASSGGPGETGGSLPPAPRGALHPRGPASHRHPLAKPSSPHTGRSPATSGAPVLHPLYLPTPARNGVPPAGHRLELDSRRAY